jgi:hypothetical protein
VHIIKQICIFEIVTKQNTENIQICNVIKLQKIWLDKKSSIVTRKITQNLTEVIDKFNIISSFKKIYFGIVTK